MIAPSLREASSTSYLTSFKHEPLNYRRGAIRLLQILPHLSIDGHIQCEIWHDSVKASYTCLSYVWGPDKIQRQILVNGKIVSVRENLYNFMRVAQSKYANPARTFWIDALCIDQDSIHEKNHQVAQMGSIYANSVEVISWLGFNQSIGRAFAFALELSKESRHEIRDSRAKQSAKWFERNKQTNGQLKKDWLAVVEDQYWTRAWITQEILLAQNLNLLVNDLEVTPMQIAGCALGRLNYINNLEGDASIDNMNLSPKTRVFKHYMYSICIQTPRPYERKLVNYFNRLPGRQSYHFHDRVYSLLPLATDASSIKVDYGISRSELLHQVISLYKTKMCICTWFYMADMLDCYHIPDSKSRDDGSGATPVFRLPMKPVHADFVMGENAKDWYSACSECTRKLSSFDAKQQTTFCIEPLCDNVQRGRWYAHNIQGGHLYVYKTKVGNYEIKREGDTTAYEVVNFQPGTPNSPSTDIELGWGSSPELYDVFLTGDVLMKLFMYPEQKLRKAVPLSVCIRAQGDAANMELC
ncbi:uncharacterized protein J4E84_008214 [Alternaria hordeiaustralica]|uniref:uncharacterized protein n=1 Tax=Alternaria hordeiaustralica TaxID=1187925 RepID=UPI0020C2B41D|nr:uncharacterized protein J4E84_008214 [Alternaria hordeiaustralica]KAI4679692.1 hypothetical protein J4E84_008214 [Alternaria hordeiaustralica]